LIIKLTKCRMLTDVEYFNTKIGKIDGSGDLGDHLIQVVKAKTITPDPNGSATSSSTPPAPEISGPPQVPEKNPPGEKGPEESPAA
jgi:vacuolar protein sorting-associated protein 54